MTTKSNKIVQINNEVTNTADAIRLCGLDWSVDEGKLQMQCWDSDLHQYRWVPMPNVKGIYRTDECRPLGNSIVGEEFTKLQNVEAFQCFDQILQDHKAEFVTGGYFHGGASVFLQCRLPQYIHRLHNGDTVERYLMIAQGHTGKAALTMRFTHIRPACANQLFAVLRNTKDCFSLRHTKNMKEGIVDAVTYMQKGLNHLAAVETKFNDMAKFSLSEKEMFNFLRLCYDRPIDENMKDWQKWSQIEPVYLSAKGASFSAGTLWHPYNVTTEYEDHHAPVYRPRGQRDLQRSYNETVSERRIKAITNKNTINRKTRAFTLADDVLSGRVCLTTGKSSETARTSFKHTVPNKRSISLPQALMF